MQPNLPGGPVNQWSNQGYPQSNGRYPGAYGQQSGGNSYNGQTTVPVRPPKSHMNSLLVPLVLSVVFLLGVSGFAVWAFMERGTYKNETDAIVAKEVELARQETSTEKDKEFIEKEKEPFREYKGPSQFGSLRLSYPKTWSAFITENDKASAPIDGYLHPHFVPGLQSGTAFALRFQILEQGYDVELKKLESKVKNGKVKVTPYRTKNVPDILGSRVTGEINKGQNNTMVLFPLRDKTLKVWTESNQFLNDFEKNILPALNFVP